MVHYLERKKKTDENMQYNRKFKHNETALAVKANKSLGLYFAPGFEQRC